MLRYKFHFGDLGDFFVILISAFDGKTEYRILDHKISNLSSFELQMSFHVTRTTETYPDNKVHGPHVGPMKIAIWVVALWVLK